MFVRVLATRGGVFGARALRALPTILPSFTRACRSLPFPAPVLIRRMSTASSGGSNRPPSMSGPDAGLRPSPPAGPSEGVIFEVDEATFQSKVLPLQETTPVILDYYADWCGPCKQLTPLLEQAVKKTKGAIRLAKINADDNPTLVQSLQVRSLPSVFLLFKGSVVDRFVGVPSEADLTRFVEGALKLSGGSAEGGADVSSGGVQVLAEAAEALEQNDIPKAAQLYAKVLSNSQWKDDHAVCLAGLLRCSLAEGNTEVAKDMAADLRKRFPDKLSLPVVANALAQLDLTSAFGDHPNNLSETELVERLKQNPLDHQARHDLALLLFQQGRHQAAIDEALQLVRRGRSWNEQAGKNLVLKFFDVLGVAHPLTVTNRKRLSAILFA